MSDLIKKNAPEANVTVQAINSRILLTGSVPNASAAGKVEALATLWAENAGDANSVVNLLAIEGKDQVMLKVRIVEMERSITKQLGFNLSAAAQLGDSSVSLINNTIGAGLTGFTGGTALSNTTSGGNLQTLAGALVALESVGLVRTLAAVSYTHLTLPTKA